MSTLDICRKEYSSLKLAIGTAHRPSTLPEPSHYFHCTSINKIGRNLESSHTVPLIAILVAISKVFVSHNARQLPELSRSQRLA